MNSSRSLPADGEVVDLMLLPVFLFLDLLLKVISLLQQKTYEDRDAVAGGLVWLWRWLVFNVSICFFFVTAPRHQGREHSCLAVAFSLSFYLPPWRPSLQLSSFFSVSVLVYVCVCKIERAHHNFLPREPWPAKFSAVFSAAPIFVQPALACAPCCTPNIAHGRESPAWSFKATPGAQALFCSPLTLSIFLLWCKAAFLKWLQNPFK